MAINNSTSVKVGEEQSDQFFTAPQQQRLATLLSQWRTARGVGQLPPLPEMCELEDLIAAEVEGAGRRAEFLSQRNE